MKNILIVFISIFAFMLVSCTSDGDDPIDQPVKNITYKDNIKSIIDSKCISCHASTPNSGAPMALVTLQQVKEAVENRDLIGRVANGSMPPGNEDLTAAQIQLIKDWEKNSFK
ncbi:cytochrome c [Aureibaculum sp. 2210JD6-5]|uniref:cytochrome c n=1 Tax=Aureibaculum sp. 2210JD6-5 TaxID=3103957 RepID=UPI002AAD1926|nr:cytochrome c [Aureibaculum sp. 2210JD6-5]MDY7396558.1 cytochrome c [Aureibaculum sp. 2210JD6-5]